MTYMYVGYRSILEAPKLTPYCERSCNIGRKYITSTNRLELLLNHFVKERLYDRDLKNDKVFETIGGGALRISRKHAGNVTVNRAYIIETEIFVYNLGTMFYIDEVLHSDTLTVTIKSDNNRNRPQNNHNYKYSTLPDVEAVPHEFTEQGGTEDDVLFQDDEIVTLRALPMNNLYTIEIYLT